MFGRKAYFLHHHLILMRRPDFVTLIPAALNNLPDFEKSSRSLVVLFYFSFSKIMAYFAKLSMQHDVREIEG